MMIAVCGDVDDVTSDFYDAFVSTAGSSRPRHGLFNTRDRAEHTRKRKIVSNTFSVKSIDQFEPYIHANIQEFVKQWDRISASATSAEAKTAGKKAYADLDALHWFNYLAFDGEYAHLIRKADGYPDSLNPHSSHQSLHPPRLTPRQSLATSPSAPPSAWSRTAPM